MTERLLNDTILVQLGEAFTQLKEPVKLLFFGRATGCDYCADALQLVEEVTAISDKLSLEKFDLDEQPAIAAQYHVDKAPGLVIAAGDGETILDYGIRFSGIPSGHEFSSLIHDLVLVSKRDSGLDARTRAFLKELSTPVLLQVFVTPT